MKSTSLVAALTAMLGLSMPDAQPVAAYGPWKQGTRSRRARVKGKTNQAGSKIARMAEECRLGVKHPGGLVSEAFRELRQQGKARGV